MTRPARNTTSAPSPAAEAQEQTLDGLPAPAGELAAEPATSATEAPAAPAAPSADEQQRIARLDAILAEVETQRAADAVRLAERNQQIDDLLAALGRQKPDGPSKVTIRANSINQDAAAKAWAMIDPARDPKDAPKFGKTYQVVPTGDSAKKGMPIATVTNAADESDAKTWYLLKLNIPPGSTLTCNVAKLPDPVDA